MQNNFWSHLETARRHQSSAAAKIWGILGSEALSVSAIGSKTCVNESLHIPAGVDRWHRGSGSLSRPHTGRWSQSLAK